MESFVVDLGHLHGAQAQVGSNDKEEEESACVGRLEVGSISVVDELPRKSDLMRIVLDRLNKHRVYQAIPGIRQYLYWTNAVGRKMLEQQAHLKQLLSRIGICKLR